MSATLSCAAVRAVKAAAKVVVRQRAGKFPATASELRDLPGIGRYTAAAIASIAFGEPVAVVDGNVERVLQRFFGRRFAGQDFWLTAEELLDRERPGDFNQAMMELGATLCTPRGPVCLACPVLEMCATRGEMAGSAKTARQKKREIHYALDFRQDAGREGGALGTPRTGRRETLGARGRAVASDPEGRGALGACGNEAVRLAGLVGQLQALARGGAGPPAAGGVRGGGSLFGRGRTWLAEARAAASAADAARRADACVLRGAIERGRAQRQLLPHATRDGVVEVGGGDAGGLSLLHEGEPRPDLLRRGIRPRGPRAGGPSGIPAAGQVRRTQDRRITANAGTGSQRRRRAARAGRRRDRRPPRRSRGPGRSRIRWCSCRRSGPPQHCRTDRGSGPRRW